MIDLSIIIVNYRTKELLRQCLDSILSSERNLVDFEVIVVDNNSQDSSPEMVRKNYQNVKIIENRINAGLSKGNNIGADIAKGEYLLFLNPDTVINKGALESMLAYMKAHREVGILGPKLVYPDGSIQESCRSFYNIRTILLRRTFLGSLFPDSSLLKKHLLQDFSHDEPHEVDWMLGACLLTPKDVFEKIGRWDNGYKLYFEDVDICYRVGQAGFKVCYYPEAVIVHHHRRDSAKGFSMKTIWHIGSALRFFRKHGWQF